MPLLLAAAIGCGDFYATNPTSTPGPTPTATPEGGPAAPVDIVRVLTEKARESISARLGRKVPAVELDEITGRPWTRRTPGCFPPPPGYSGDYIIPGLVTSVFFEDVRYEYHSDATGATGALCQSVAQLLSFTDLAELGDISRPEAFLNTVVTARDENEARALIESSGGAISLQLDDIDWAGENLVGTSVSGTGCSFSATANSVEWNIDAGKITLEIVATSKGACEQEHAASVFVLIEGGPTGVPYDVDVRSESDTAAPARPSPAPGPESPGVATPIPAPVFEALETAVAGGE